ncbi:hypothetical protein [Nonomuraea lactucae]|uniref:hypothetical protein n=1 Tax=Nonomuraea lactucae TaxID=2249762 RepID=UPI0013B441E8|nr:hypothetical protein [Nonomuraea lactucae]
MTKNRINMKAEDAVHPLTCGAAVEGVGTPLERRLPDTLTPCPDVDRDALIEIALGFGIEAVCVWKLRLRCSPDRLDSFERVWDIGQPYRHER